MDRTDIVIKNGRWKMKISKSLYIYTIMNVKWLAKLSVTLQNLDKGGKCQLFTHLRLVRDAKIWHFLL